MLLVSLPKNERRLKVMPCIRCSGSIVFVFALSEYEKRGEEKKRSESICVKECETV